jgi:hypothetical protein
VTVTGNITGGGGASSNAPGFYNVSTGAVTVVGNLINTTGCNAIGGGIVYNPGAANYIQYGATKYPAQLAAAVILEGTVHGDRVGTYHPADVSEVRAGVTFGASEAEAGIAPLHIRTMVGGG